MPSPDLTRSRVYIAGRIFDAILSYSDDREPIIAENTFLNHLGADLEVTGMKARILKLKGVILGENDVDMQTLDDILTVQQKDAITLSIPDYGVFEGFAESVHIERSGEIEGHDFDITFKEHSPVERPEVTAANVAQAVAAAADTGVAKTHHVVKGDTYWALALKYLGDCRLWRKIADLNPQYEARRIPIGATLRIT